MGWVAAVASGDGADAIGIVVQNGVQNNKNGNENGGEHEDWRGRGFGQLVELHGQLESADERHLIVTDDDRGVGLNGELVSLLAILSGEHVISSIAQFEADNMQDMQFVIDDENRTALRLSSHDLSPCPDNPGALAKMGSETRNVLPVPCWLSTSTLPP